MATSPSPGGSGPKTSRKKGKAPETVRVRFSFTFKYDGGGWRTLFYHRDHQTFDAQGAYLRTP
jgi:hypothetical protein